MKPLLHRPMSLIALFALLFVFTIPAEAAPRKKYIKARMVQKQPPVKMAITGKPQPRQTYYENRSGFINSRTVNTRRKIVESDRYIAGPRRHTKTFNGGRGGSPDYAGASHRWHF